MSEDMTLAGLLEELDTNIGSYVTDECHNVLLPLMNKIKEEMKRLFALEETMILDQLWKWTGNE